MSNYKNVSYFLSLCFFCSFLSAQQLAYKELAPYEEFRIQKLTFDNEGVFYMRQPFTNFLFRSNDGSDWSKISTEGLGVISDPIFTLDNDLLLTSSDSLYIRENNQWKSIYDKKSDKFRLYTNGNDIYVMDSIEVFKSDDKGSTFSIINNNVNQSIFLNTQYFIALSDGYYITDYNTLRIYNTSFVLKQSLELVNAGEGLNSFHYDKKSGYFYYISADRCSESLYILEKETLTKTHFYRAYQDKIWGVAIKDEAIYFNSGLSEFYSKNILTHQTYGHNILSNGQLLFNQDKLFHYNTYQISEIKNYDDIASQELIDQSLKFDYNDFRDFQVSRDGVLYLLNYYNLYVTSVQNK